MWQLVFQDPSVLLWYGMVHLFIRTISDPTFGFIIADYRSALFASKVRSIFSHLPLHLYELLGSLFEISNIGRLS